MRCFTTLLLVVAVTVGCGGDDQTTTTTSPGQAAACEATRRTITGAADAYTASTGDTATSIDDLADYLEPRDETAWFVIDDGVVTPDVDGPCA